MALAKIVKSEKGVFIVFVAAAIVVLGLFVGLALDAGRAYLLWADNSKMVDAASLAAAKAMGNATTFDEATSSATTAACDLARVNGHNVDGGSGTCPPGITVSVRPLTNPDGTTQFGVTVTGTNTMNTSFMALGSLIGCGDACRTVNVSASASAVPDTLIDLVLVLDETGTMSETPRCNSTQTNSDCPIKQARDGATALVGMLLADPNSRAKIALVPFRGCYSTGRQLPAGMTGPAGSGCVLFSEILPLTNDTSALTTRISTLKAPGGYPGTNICLGMREGDGTGLSRGGIFGPASRALARKIMVVLTDGDNRYSDGANRGPPPSDISHSGNNPNTPTGPFAPPTYPPPQWPNDTIPASQPCRVEAPALDPTGNGTNHNHRVKDLDVSTNSRATALKNPADPNLRVEIFVLRFASPSGDLSATTPCNPSLVSSTILTLDRRNSNEQRDRNLSRCIASNTAMGDPFSTAVNDHYFYAATPPDINTQFQAIAKELLKKLRLVV